VTQKGQSLNQAPASVRSECSQTVDEHASKPTRSSVIAYAPKTATSASVSMATRNLTHELSDIIDDADGRLS
jgi:hypothetical protein